MLCGCADTNVMRVPVFILRRPGMLTARRCITTHRPIITGDRQNPHPQRRRGSTAGGAFFCVWAWRCALRCDPLLLPLLVLCCGVLLRCAGLFVCASALSWGVWWWAPLCCCGVSCLLPFACCVVCHCVLFGAPPNNALSLLSPLVFVVACRRCVVLRRARVCLCVCGWPSRHRKRVCGAVFANESRWSGVPPLLFSPRTPSHQRVIVPLPFPSSSLLLPTSSQGAKRGKTTKKKKRTETTPSDLGPAPDYWPLSPRHNTAPNRHTTAGCGVVGMRFAAVFYDAQHKHFRGSRPVPQQCDVTLSSRRCGAISAIPPMSSSTHNADAFSCARCALVVLCCCVVWVSSRGDSVTMVWWCCAVVMRV